MRTCIRWGWWAALLCALPAAAGPARAADDKPTADTKAIDGLVYATLRDVINEGADMYNAQGRYANKERDYAGCYRFYEGALTATRPLLAHRPALQKAIDDGLATARETPQVFQRAFVLRDVIDKVRAEVNPNPPPKPAALWDRLGGEAGVAKVVDDFTAAALADKKLDLTRGGKYLKDEAAVAHFKRMMVELVSVAGGGPLKYTGRPMKEVHKGMAITDAEFDLAAGHLREALKKNGVKDDDAKELLADVETTRKDIVEGKKEPPKPTTLWERMGGEPAVTKAVDDFADAAKADEKLDLSRGGKFLQDEDAVRRAKKGFIDWISSVTGGERKYTGKSMKELHKGMEITDEQFDLALKHFKAALAGNGVKEPEIKDVMKILEATRPAVVEGKKEPPKPALWERIGGEKTVGKVVDDFVAAAAADKDADFLHKPEPPPREKVNTIKADLLLFLSAAAKAPGADKAKGLKEALGGAAYTDKQFDALVKDLKEALKKNGVEEADAKEITAAVEAARKDVVEKKDDSPKPPEETGSVKGKATFKGEPLPGGVVTFEAEGGGAVTAKIAEDGTYKADGLKPGKYAVTVDTELLKPDPAKPADPKAPKYVAIPEKYRDAKKSGLSYEVKKGEQTYDIELKD
jgi:truncated hemoglobin YjbI